MKFKLPEREPDSATETSRRWDNFFCDRERYFYDFGMCPSEDGWRQFDTQQDAPYFGIWVHEKERIIITFAEGDECVIHYNTQEALIQELKRMNEFYGECPPAFIALLVNDEKSEVVKVYDERPTGIIP